MSTNEEVLQKLPNDAVRAALLQVIEENIHSKVYSLHMEQGSIKGDNYIGVVHRLNITYKDSEKNPKKAGVFIKVPPENLIRRQQFFARPCFLRESLMYDEYLPLLVEFQESKYIIPEENGFSQFATCYKTLTDDLKEAIFMEDLSLKGYVMQSRFESPSFELVKVLFKSLGKLHALSFALKDQWPKRLAKFQEIDEIFAQRRDDDMFLKYLNGMTDVVYQVLSKEGDEKYLKICKAFFERGTMFNLLMKLTDGSKAEPYAVVSHGDCWNNNMLFKYDNEKPIDVKLIDWQIARYATPICDLMYYMFACTTKALRDAHFAELMNVYHTELSAFLQRLGSDPDVLFPRAAFDDQFKKFGSIGLVMGLILIPTITTNSEDTPDLDDLSAKLEAGDETAISDSFTVSELANSRIRDVIIDLIELGALEEQVWDV